MMDWNHDTMTFPEPGLEYARPSEAAEKRKVELEAEGKTFQKVVVAKSEISGLKVNRESDLEVWLTPSAIEALTDGRARFEIAISDVGVSPKIILDQFRGRIRAGFRSGEAALIVEKCRNFNMQSLFYERSYMQIGKESSCNFCTATLSDASIIIGKDCMLSHDVVLQPSDQHDILDLATGDIVNKKRSIVIGDHVWLGKGAYLGAGCSVGSDAVIGARSVVVGEVGPKTIVAGNPAREIRREVSWTRNFSKREFLEDGFPS